MAAKKTTGAKNSSYPAKAAKQTKNAASFETGSQAQNRHGNGRAQNGSDGSDQGGRGKNH